MDFDEGGFAVGIVAGGMMSLATAAHHAAGEVRQQQKNLATIQSWSIVLDRANRRAIAAERELQRALSDNAQLLALLSDAQAELAIWRGD